MIESQLNGRMLVSDPRDREIFNTQLLYFTCSSLSEDGERVYMISDKIGSPNVIVRDLVTGEETYLTDNPNTPVNHGNKLYNKDQTINGITTRSILFL